MTGNGGASSGHGVWQSVTTTRRSIGPLFRSHEPAQAGADVRAPAAVQRDLRGREHFSHVVHDDITAGDDDVGAVSELTRQSAELGDGPRQLRILHRAGRVDQEARARTRLVEG